MGQAKQRGSFEERRAQAFERDKKVAEERYKDVLEKSKLEREKPPKRRSKIAPYISMAALMGHGLGGIFGSDEFWGPPKKKNT